MFGHRYVAFQPGLVRAARPALRANVRELELAPLSGLVKQAIEHGHVLLLGVHGGGVAGRGGGLRAAFGIAFRVVFRTVFRSVFSRVFRRAFLDWRLGIRLTHCHNAWYTPESRRKPDCFYIWEVLHAVGRIAKPTTSAKRGFPR